MAKLHRLTARAIALCTLAGLLSGAAAAAGSGLRLLRVSPAGDEFEPGQQIVFKFDRDMVPLGGLGRTFKEIPIEITPAVPCQWRWIDTTELACRLSGQQRLRPATKYSITVGTDLVALDGSRLPKPAVIQFTTERPALSGFGVKKWLSPTRLLMLAYFNYPVTKKAVERTVVLDGGAKGTIALRATPPANSYDEYQWLPVPDQPGLVLQIHGFSRGSNRSPGRHNGSARASWLLTPATALSPATAYELRVKPGLITPLGSLPGRGGTFDGGPIRTYGPFDFVGFTCRVNYNTDFLITRRNHKKTRCEPGQLWPTFTAPVPVTTLAAMQWTPAPLPATTLAARWKIFEASTQPETDLNSPDGGEPSRYWLPFELAPMTRFTVTAPAGVEDRFGRKLPAAETVTFRTGHRAPYLANFPDFAVLESGVSTIVPVVFTNLSKLDFTYSTLHAGDLHGAAQVNARKHPVTSILHGAGPAVKEDSIVTAPLGLRRALDQRPGVLWGELQWAPQTSWRYSDESLFGEVTPWNVVAKVGWFSTLVWVTSFKSGAPVTGVKVSLYTDRQSAPGELVRVGQASVTTDANGIAVLPGCRTFDTDYWDHYTSNSLRYYVSATRGDGVALLPLQGSVRSYPGSLWGGTDFEPYGQFAGWAFTEQGVYRRGSVVHYALFVRGLGNSGAKPPPLLHYLLSIVGPSGTALVRRQRITLSPFGEFSGNLKIPTTAPMGRYEIRLSQQEQRKSYYDDTAAGSFLVTDFVPASFSVHTRLQRDVFGPGDVGTAAVTATSHAGGPYGNASVKYVAAINPRDFSPDAPASSGFTFDANPEDAKNVPVLETGSKLNAKGEAAEHFTVPDTDKILYGRLVFEGSVKSPRGTWVSNAATATYAARDRFIGLRLDQWLLQANQPNSVQYLVVDVAGNPAAGASLRIELQRGLPAKAEPTVSDEEHDHGPKLTWTTESVCTGKSTAEPGHCSLTPKHPGKYRVRATVTDTHGRKQTTVLQTWVTGTGSIAWGPDKQVTLVPDQASYLPGQTAHVLVQNPYPGAEALVTIERYGVISRRIVHLEGTSPIIDVPIKRDYFPGVYLSVAIAKGRTAPPDASSAGNPALTFGYTALPVSGRGNTLKVEVTPSAHHYKPREAVNVNVKVQTASGGTPLKTRLVAAVVDQGVLDLLEQGKDYYDPNSSFYRPLTPYDGPDTDNYVLSDLLSTRLQPVVKQAVALGGHTMTKLSQMVEVGSYYPDYMVLGYGKSEPSIRSIFRYSTYWNPALATDDRGRAHFSFRLPDNLTRWRIFVIAMTPGAAMGLGDASVRVSLPIQLEAALPNQVHAGDRFDAGFSVANRTASKRSIATQVQANGPIEGGNKTTQSVFSVDPNGRAFAWLPLLTQQPGIIHVAATATAGTLGDAMAATIPVRPAETPVVDASYGSTTGAAASVPVRSPPKAVPGSVKLSVTLAPTLLGNLGPVFEDLRDDPLQFWEVRLSRAVMASNYLELKPVLPDSVSWPSASADIEQALAAASDFQAPNGGMAFWIPRGDFVSPYLSVYTALAFDWLQAAGHPAPPAVVASLDGYLHKQILDAKPKKDGEEDPTAPILRAGALLALAPGGTVPKDAVAAMLPDLPKLDLFGKSLLLEAAVELKDAQSAAMIARMLLSQAEESAGSISLNETQSDAYTSLLATPVRANCAALDALSLYAHTAAGQTLAGDVPEKLARWIAGRRRDAGAWLNSQENVFCTTALAHYSDSYEASVRNLDGRVSLGTYQAGGARFESRRSAPKTIPVPPPASAANTPARVTIARSGTGRLYYGVQLSYAEPAGTAGPVDAGFTVKRRYYVQHGADWTPVGPDTQLARGDIVRVDLDVDAPTERHYVVLTDPLPGAFEAVNRNLATSARSLPHAEPGTAVLWFDYGPWPDFSITTGGFYHRETAFDAVRFYADNLLAGHYRLIYSAQVISPGSFVAPPPLIEEIYQPDVFGRGEAARIEVVLPKD